MKLRKILLAPILAVVVSLGTPALADTSQTYYDQGVYFTITQVGDPGSFNFILNVDTTNYTGGSGVYLTNVDVKVSTGGGSFTSYTGPGDWADPTLGTGPVSNNNQVSADGCGTGNGGFLCLSEQGTNDAPAGTGGVYSFSYTASGTLIDPTTWHVGARFADASDVKVGDLVSTTSPIPEPEIYAMLVAGFGLMGFVARRRKQQIAA